MFAVTINWKEIKVWRDGFSVLFMRGFQLKSSNNEWTSHFLSKLRVWTSDSSNFLVNFLRGYFEVKSLNQYRSNSLISRKPQKIKRVPSSCQLWNFLMRRRHGESEKTYLIDDYCPSRCPKSIWLNLVTLNGFGSQEKRTSCWWGRENCVKSSSTCVSDIFFVFDH